MGARDGSGLARSGTGRPSCPRRRGPSSRSPSSLGGRSPPSRSPGGRSLRWRRPARRHGLPRSLRARRPRRRTGLLAGVTGRLQSARPAAPGAGSLPPPALPSAPQGGSPFGQRARLRLSRRLKDLARCQSALARCGPLGLAGAVARAPRSLHALRPRAVPGLPVCQRPGLVSAAGFALRVWPCAAWRPPRALAPARPPIRPPRGLPSFFLRLRALAASPV